MAIVDLFSKRQKLQRGEVPDIFIYDYIPRPLRIQIIQLLQDAIGEKRFSAKSDRPKLLYADIHKSLTHEYGEFTLSSEITGESNEIAVLNFLLLEPDIERVLDVVEIGFKFISLVIKPLLVDYKQLTEIKIDPDPAIEELNYRFKEHGVGYQFEGNRIIRIDSTYIHAEVVKPVLSLLSDKKFKGANEEYLNAHEHYRFGRNKECLVECAKSFESVMKIICKEKGWTYDQKDTAKKLIEICLKNDLVPKFTQNQFTSLGSLLESGIPTIRNRLGGHGQGQAPQKVDDGITRYALNLTGSNILFLIEQSGI